VLRSPARELAPLSFRGDAGLGLARLFRHRFELRLEAAAQPAIDAVEIDIDDGNKFGSPVQICRKPTL